ncbi:MAG TPA: pectin acetylesterase-family hydrolase [Labilithrix sp.]|nr:pectin acetylesterase-family hydrolase [Labilithrix sp.]
MLLGVRALASVLFLCALAIFVACTGDGDHGAPDNAGDASTTAPGSSNDSGSSSSGGNDGATADPPVTCEAFEKSAPITAPEKTWTWVDFDDSLCMNGSKTGIGVNLNSASKDVLIYLQGGNACFNYASCRITANLDGYNADTFAESVTPSSDGDNLARVYLFKRDEEKNLFKDWNYVYIPYCSGDVYAGDKDSFVGLGNRKFRGFRNITAFLKRIAPTFPNAGKILLTGQSAGGFGAAYNYDQFSRAFCPKPVILVDDSGPPMGEEFVPPCLQKHFIETWGIDKTLPPDCAECAERTKKDGVFIEPFLKHVTDKYAGHELGIVSTVHDETIRRFWAFGNNDCAATELPQSYPAEKYQKGLEDVRDRFGGPGSRVRAFLAPGTFHCLVHEDPTTFAVGDLTLRDWLEQAITRDPAWKNVP